MNLEDYLRQNESVVSSVEAFDGKTSIGTQGTLAVTPNRVVFVRDKLVSDIFLNGVDSIEYRAPSYPTQFLYWAVGMFCVFVLSLVLTNAEGVFGDIALLASMVAALSAVAIGVAGFLFQRSMLTLNTSNRTFEFSSTDETLAEIAHALRGYEQR